jgi:hypothetical protein
MSLRGFSSVSDLTFSQQVLQNLISFFDWGLLNIGAFVNVRIGSGDKYVLSPANVPGTSAGTVWESRRGNWVWESGISYANQPTPVSGIYVATPISGSSVFMPNDNTQYYVDYPNGQVHFNPPLSLNSSVQLNYSYKMFNFYSADYSWFHEIVTDPLDTSTLNQVLAENRAYLPAVVVEIAPSRTFSGYELGDFTMDMKQAILFHIITEKASDRDKMLDYISMQYYRTIVMYDVNKVATANRFPLTGYGYPASGALMYPDLVNNFKWKTTLVENMRVQEVVSHVKLFRAVIRMTLQAYVP